MATEQGEKRLFIVFKAIWLIFIACIFYALAKELFLYKETPVPLSILALALMFTPLVIAPFINMKNLEKGLIIFCGWISGYFLIYEDGSTWQLGIYPTLTIICIYAATRWIRKGYEE